MSAASGELTLRPAAGESKLRVHARALLRGRVDDPVWARPALLGLLAATALLYLVDLAASRYANGFYAAAVEAGAKSWKAFFFGSFDSSNFITVDKPPASLWVMDLSARLFGVSSWSILAPQALEGVASVALLYATVRRRFSAGAGLLAGGVFALTPVAALMFRYDNPDALLTLLLVAAAYAFTRALERAGWRWVLLAAALIGLGFLAKMLQAFLVVPGFALVYLIAAPASPWRRLAQLLTAGAAMIVAAGWWVAIVALWPAASRPYIGGSQDNSILNLIFGYNGFGRITGNERGSVIGGRAVGGGGGAMWGPTGLLRLFGSEMGTQISWLLPAALIALVGLLLAFRRGGRTDGRRAAVLLWGSWLVVTGLVFSFMQGIVHPYYNVVLAPPIGALVGIGAVVAWQRRGSLAARLASSGAIAASVVWAFVLLDRTPDWLPWLRYCVLLGGLAAAALVVLGGTAWLLRAAFAVGLAAAVAAPAAYAVQTSATPHTGAIPTAGPSGSVALGRPGGGGRPFGAGPGAGFRSRTGRFGAANTAPPAGGFGPPGAAGGVRGFGGFAPGGGGGGALGGLLGSGTPGKALVTLLRQDASRYHWVAAVIGANSGAGIQLATDEPVMAIGGFNGTDPAPTLAEFEADVFAGKVHYFIAAGAGGGRGGVGSSSSSNAITSWVEAHYTAKTVGGVTVYDLTAPA